MFKVDFRESGGGNRNDWYSEAGRVLSQSLWRARGGGCHSAWPGKKKRALWVIFWPVSSYMSWKAKSRFNASFLRQGTKSLFVPQWNLSLKSCTTSCEIQPCRCASGDPPGCATITQSARMGTLYYCWAENNTYSSDPHWGSQVDKTSCLGEGSWAVDVCVILFCSFVSLFSYL